MNMQTAAASAHYTSQSALLRSAARVRPRLSFWLPIALTALALLTISGELGYAASGGEEVYGTLVGSTISRQAAFLTLGVMGSLLLLFTGRKSVAQPRWEIAVPVCMLCIYLFLTTLWSDAPTITAKRAIVVICMVLAGFGLGRSWRDYRDFAVAIFALSSCFLIASVLAELYYRAFLFDPVDYRFSGIFHPGMQAFNCGMLTLASLSLFRKDRRWLFLVVAGLAFAFLALTKARTGMLATLVSGCFLVWPHLSWRSALAGFSALTGATIVILIFVGATGRELDASSIVTMGRDKELADPSKLTGRLPIWKHAWELYSDRPLLGFGYGAFWTELRLSDFERRNGWPLAHAHSSYLESLVNLGLLGFSLGISISLIALVRSIRISKLPGYSEARMIAALILMAYVSGITEMGFVSTSYEFLAIQAGLGVLTFQVPRAGRRVRP